MTGTAPSVAMRRWQRGLVALGLALLLIGGVTALNDVPPTRYLGIAGWLAGAIVIHDGVIAMSVFAASVILRKTAARVPLVVVSIVQGALVVGGIVTILVVPEIVKRAIGTANPSILPLDYLSNLLWFYAALGVAAALAVAAYLVIVRVRRSRGTP